LTVVNEIKESISHNRPSVDFLSGGGPGSKRGTRGRPCADPFGCKNGAANAGLRRVEPMRKKTMDTAVTPAGRDAAGTVATAIRASAASAAANRIRPPAPLPITNPAQQKR
jgi:hypothetical protein